MISRMTIVRGLQRGLRVTWELSKVVIPVIFIVTTLKYTPVLPWISQVMAGSMGVLGLPGEASLALVMGFAINVYAAIGVIVSLDLTIRQITILAMMINMAHSLPIETAINKKTGANAAVLLLLRLGFAFICGWTFNGLWR